MTTLRRILCLLTAFALSASADAARLVGPAESRPGLLDEAWPAFWIAAPGTEPFDHEVQHFRRTFQLAAVPERFVVHVSADNRYQLFVNGQRVAWGPARGDLNHWRFESLDLAPHLQPGRNTLAAVVWNHGEHAAESQVTWRTGFLLHGDGAAESVLDTGPAWKAFRNPAYQPIPFTHEEMRGYFVVGPGERIDASRYPWGWEAPGFDDRAWPQAVLATGNRRARGLPRLTRNATNRWLLVPRDIPLMEESPLRIARLRQASGAAPAPGFPRERAAWTVAPHQKAVLILDQEGLTTGYPELTVSGGAGARVRLAYAEALFESVDRESGKGDRNAVDGKVFVGNHDLFLPDGGRGRVFRPLWWRTWRYLELTIETQDEALVVEDLQATFTAYPFERRARFDAGDPLLDRILDVGWRTARLCAHETYFDCPYYEQLQYAGDTRIQALVSFYMSGDGRLARAAIAHLDASRTAEGATMSRAPTRQQQYIPGFSLWWIGMLHDYWRHVDDPEFVRSMLPGVRAVLGFFAGYQREDGSLNRLPWWRFFDWVLTWPSGSPPPGPDGGAAAHDLQLLLALDWAAELESALGSAARAAECREGAARLRATIGKRYWSAERRLFADTTAHDAYSQHVNALAIIAGVVVEAEARALMERVLADDSLTPCSLYFRHYLHEAVLRAGLGDRYLGLLGQWEQALDSGLTTWPERNEDDGRPSRSDCHAWSSSPNFEIFRTVLGIESAAAAMATVRIAPHPGRLERASGSVPHPRGGEIRVSLERAGTGLVATVELPAGVAGTFVWAGESRPLQPGLQELRFP
jgi:hypothetical protein